MSNYIKKIIEEIKKNYVMFVIEIALYVIGIIVGFVAIKNGNIFEIFYQNVTDLCTAYLSKSYSPIGLFFIRLFICAVLILLFALCSLKKPTVIVQMFIITFRGFVLGISMICLYEIYSVIGIIIGFFVIFPQSVITTLSLIALSVVGFGKEYCDGYKPLLILSTFSFAISLIGCLYELLVLIAVIRPITFYV